jgi:hypothetical protein
MDVDQWGMFTVSVARRSLTNINEPTPESPLPLQGRR